jgi:hypothetical protein
MTSPKSFSRLVFVTAAFGSVLGDAAYARMATPPPLATMVRDAARIFRGHCMSARPDTIEIAGARLPVTVYRFRVGEHLKGGAAHTVTFRQLGAAGGGRRDLGRLVGLPVYAPGSEYVLFLLPASAVGMTSPAGAGDGAFAVEGEQVRGVRAHPESASPTSHAAQTIGAAIAPGEAMSYESLRGAIRAELAR